MNSRVREMSIDALFIALYFALAFSPIGFYFSFFGLVNVSGTTLHILVLIVAFLGDFRRTILLGFVFGLVSLLRAWLAPVYPGDILFINPLLSVVPRVLFGILAAYFGRFVVRHFSSQKSTYLVATAIGAGILTIAHTILVLGAVYLVENATFIGSFLPALGIILSGLAVVEVVLAVTLVPMVSSILRQTPFFRIERGE